MKVLTAHVPTPAKMLFNVITTFIPGFLIFEALI